MRSTSGIQSLITYFPVFEDKNYWKKTVYYIDPEQSMSCYCRQCLIISVIPSSICFCFCCRRVNIERDRTFWSYTLMVYIENIDMDCLDL